MKTRALFFTFIFVALGFCATAQSLFEKMSNVPVLTPQAAAFAKYVEFPVSHYNGVVDVSIPIHTLSVGDLNVPITLSYHAGGIRVAEEASWVGLGWNLNVGGVISRQIVGEDDFNPSYQKFFGLLYPEPVSTFNEAEANRAHFPFCYRVYDDDGSPIYNSLTNEVIGNIHVADGSPDLFIYNFGSYSGKFLHTENNLDLGRSNISFSVSSTGIVAKAPDGTIYEFMEVERGWVGFNPSSPMSFYLTKIKSPTGKLVVFNYTVLPEIQQLPSFSEEFSVKYGGGPGTPGSPGGLTWRRSYNWCNPVYLESIVWDEGSLIFETGVREDTEGRRLERIELRDKNSNVRKSIYFNYAYFVGEFSRHFEQLGFPESPDPSLTFPEDYLRKRMKLVSLEEKPVAAATNINPIVHSFEYYEGGPYVLPFKTSYATDYWGFYNGQKGNTHFLPSGRDVTSLIYHQDIYNFIGANKTPDEEVISAWMLKKVSYPSKGYTTYHYSMHDYSNINESVPKHRIRELGNIMDIGTGIQESIFTVEGDFDLQVSLFCDCAVNSCACTQPSNPVWDCGDANSSGLGTNVLYAQLLKLDQTTNTFLPISPEYLWDVNDILPCGQNSTGEFNKAVSLGAGTFKMVVNFPDNKSGSPGTRMAYMRAYFEEQYFELNPGGGGVRISQINHFPSDGAVPLTRTFSYIGGKLMHFPRYYWRRPSLEWVDFDQPNSGGEMYLANHETLYSSPVVPYSSSAIGSTVGYSKVVETFSAVKLVG